MISGQSVKLFAASGFLLITGIIVCLLASCKSKPQITETMKTNDTATGTFGHDLEFLSKYKETVVLSDSQSQAQVVIIPGWQARVMTSTTSGNSGFSFGWINYKLISSGKSTPHINAFGGEERLWLGPEGGQFSVYFAKGAKQEFSNWFVPAELDTIGYELVSKNKNQASFKKEFQLVNYSGTTLNIGIERTISLLSRKSISQYLGLVLPDSISCVAYQSANVLNNLGKNVWTRETGMLSIWMLSMLNPSPEVTIFIPYIIGIENKLVKIVHDDYFGKVPLDRLIVENGIIYFKADGKYRSKIGIPPQRASEFSGSYDASRSALTLLWCDLPKGKTDYVNSKWEIQKDPFSGDAINAYNDGPVEDGTQMGPFYELESSSPAANLKPGEKLTHTQRIFHFTGNEAELSRITEKIFGVSLEEIVKKFR
jgi:hypothetical protein